MAAERTGMTARLWLTIVAAVLLLIVTAAVTMGWIERGQDESTEGYQLEGRKSSPPWPIPADPRSLIQAAGLDLGPMGMAEHYHPTLRIHVDGERVQVPANIGIEPLTGAMSALHTHSADGVLHVEADSVDQKFTLGQLFTQWNVFLSGGQIGGVAGELLVQVNEEPFDGDPADLVLAPRQRIEIQVQS